MKKSRLVYFAVIIVLMVSGVQAKDRVPVLVSPGVESGTAVVSQACPTFSWTAVDWAEGYHVAVFKASGSEVLNFEEMEVERTLVLSKQINGRAYSWTPTEDTRLSGGEVYVWYVKAVDGNGGGLWSEGRMFKLEERMSLVGVENKIRESLKQKGVDEDIINRAMEDGFSGIKEVELKNSSQIGTVSSLGTEGPSNTFYGTNAGNGGMTGTGNAFFGKNSGYANASGYYNTFIGISAGYSNTAGDQNTFVGNTAGYNNISGYNNSFSGYSSGYANNTGSYNTFSGYRSGFNNITGNYNTFSGSYAGYNNVGNSNAFTGSYSGFSNSTATANAFFGAETGYNTTEGGYNTFFGQRAGYSNQTGHHNTYLGKSAGYYSKTGSYNSYLGLYSGYSSKGSRNVFIGYKAGYKDTGSDRLYISNSDTITPLLFGRFDTKVLRINGKLGVGKLPSTHPIEVTGGAYCNGTTWVDASSRALKNNIEELEGGEALATLKNLQPVKFNYKSDQQDGHVGFIAEDVPDLVATKDRKGMSAMDVVAVLTKVVKEQQKSILEQKKTNKELNERISKLEEKKN